MVGKSVGIVRVESAKCENALVKETRCVITSVRNTGIDKAMDKRGKSKKERESCHLLSS